MTKKSIKNDKIILFFNYYHNNKHLFSKTFKDLENIYKINLLLLYFCFLIDIKFVDKYDKSGTFYLKNGTKIPVSSRKKESFLSTLF
ncbi:LytTR family transcriptional regulator DNA-binding domain-containing protein [Flavobacterium piscinae]|uniref:Uncharacterized protein n=1 Tax=Flavobacterium piscinae TaxID=2506424 RepID=A0A4V1N3W6_9FLAO|nr:LytTR family transcriptional regulator DNA-binding domain-containing protein [Flavobacterium piscinae]MBC8882898.1 LytTR family transcriptional regulator DNA-binding domain-containing protein [Flavobacterium piscinae]RXR30096.1 hypothetical protein EQG68_11740 [Flavobacterium piscinae]